jgi:hypothetical protein
MDRDEVITLALIAGVVWFVSGRSSRGVVRDVTNAAQRIANKVATAVGDTLAVVDKAQAVVTRRIVTRNMFGGWMEPVDIHHMSVDKAAPYINDNAPRVAVTLTPYSH